MEGVRLEWEGKRPAAAPEPPSLACCEIYGLRAETESDVSPNRLIQGDNLEVMAALRQELAGQFALLYFDPPFFTGMQWQANAVGSGADSLHAYSDAWPGPGAYLQWMLDRLTLARELLAEDGSLYVHLDWRSAHYARLLLDEVFGANRFQNEIIWCYREAINSRKRWNRKHDTILFYSKGEKFAFHADAVRDVYAESHIRKYRHRDEKGVYRLMGRGITGSPLRSRRDLPPKYETLYPGLTYRHYLGQGTLPVDYWLIDIENQASHARTGYPTQKPEALLERILLASSQPGDLIGDFCCGSGTTLAVASRLGRRWIGVDSGALAIHTARKRLLENAALPFQVGRADALAAPHEAALLSRRLNRISPLNAALPGALEAGGVDGKEAGLACSVGEAGSWKVRLCPEVCAQADMWAVEWLTRQAKSAAVFRPQEWFARTRRNPALEPLSSLCPARGIERARVGVADAAGQWRWQIVHNPLAAEDERPPRRLP